MNLLRNLALSPTGSAARRSAAFSLNSFVGTWRCCWRFRIRNCLKASWSEGPVSRSASSWPLAVISARGAMGCGLLGSLRVSPTRSGGAAKTVGRLWAAVREDGAAVRRAQHDTGTDWRREIPNDTPLAEPLSQRSMGLPPAAAARSTPPRATRTEASGRKALASWASGTKARPTMGR